MAQSAMTTAGYNEVVGTIYNAGYTEAKILYDMLAAAMTRLSQSADPTKIVGTNPNAGQWQTDIGSFKAWLDLVVAGDTAAIVQVVALHATATIRLAL